jgi:LPXTG-motif cell wall-anchored protein
MRKSIFGIILLIAGLVCVGVSFYIKNQVAQGKEMIGSAQEKVDKGNSFLSIAPGGKEVGGFFSKSAQGKIDRGADEIKHYEEISNWLMIGGVIFAGLGLWIVFMRKK